MELQLSLKMRRVARSYNISQEELVYADLVALGWPEPDAYKAAFRPSDIWSKTAIAKEQAELKKNAFVKKRIADSKLVTVDNSEEDEQKPVRDDEKAILERATNKEAKIVELQKKLEAAKDNNEWLKINQQILDVTRMKKDEIKTDDTTIHYVLPVNYPTSCENCLLFKEKK